MSKNRFCIMSILLLKLGMLESLRTELDHVTQYCDQYGQVSLQWIEGLTSE